MKTSGAEAIYLVVESVWAITMTAGTGLPSGTKHQQDLAMRSSIEQSMRRILKGGFSSLSSLTRLMMRAVVESRTGK